MKIINLLTSFTFFIFLAFASCSSEGGEHAEGHHGDGDEESGAQYGLNETCNEVRNGVRLILSFDSQKSTFIGSIENTTGSKISNVRVEVHLSNNVELGPTPNVDLAPGETKEVSLSASGQKFEKWSAHAEVG